MTLLRPIYPTDVLKVMDRNVAFGLEEIATGRIVYATEALEDMFGYTVRGELVGHQIDDLVPERLRGGHAGHREAFHGDPHRRPMGADLDLTGLRKDGTEFPVEISLDAAVVSGIPCVGFNVIDMTGRAKNP